MPQTVCRLATYSFPYNPYPYNDPPLKSTAHVTTLGGGYDTVWGTFVQDRQIKMTWATIDRPFYQQLATLYAAAGTLTFLDPYGVGYTVLFTDLTPAGLLKGGDDALENVVATLRIVSQP